MPNLPGPSIDLYIGPNPYALSNKVAFRIFPIAHQYDMHIILKYSERAVEATIQAAIRAEEAASKAEEAAMNVDAVNKAVAEAASQAASEAVTAAHDLSPLALWPPAPIASSQVAKHPGLIQWLALAAKLHCESLVETCLSHLFRLPDGTIQGVLTSPHLGDLVGGLAPEIMMTILRGTAGLPLGFKVLWYCNCRYRYCLY